MNLKELSATVHAANIKWWQDPVTQQPIKRNKGELLALIHSEISEGADGDVRGLMDDKLVHRQMLEVELVDALIRIFDYCAGFGHDIYTAGLKYGVSELDNLDHIEACVSPIVLNGIRNSNATHGGLLACHCKISQVLEHERKGRTSEATDALVELIITICCVAKRRRFDLQKTYEEKMNFNSTREDHKHEARVIAGGKQF